jgi:hypothetical protein
MPKKQSSEYQLYAGLSRYFNGVVMFLHAFLSRSFQREILNKNPNLWMETI